MTEQEILNACISVAEELRKTFFVPNPKTRGKTSTGNLAFNALKYEIKDGVFDLYIDENIAPYMPYTNEPWIAKRWNGKKNPNEGWWERFANEFARRLNKKLKGKLKND